MNDTITITKASFVKLLDAVLYPPWDDPGDPHNPFGPYGPIGPVIQEWLRVLLNPQPLPPRGRAAFFEEWLSVLLNPQPLPPRTGSLPGPLRAGPHPEPWRGAWLARTVIDRAISEYQLAEVVSGGEPSEGTIAAVRGHIRKFVEDWWCPIPWPWPRPPIPPNPVEFLAAGVQFHKASEGLADHPLRKDFAAAAAQLFETGLKQIQRG